MRLRWSRFAYRCLARPERAIALVVSIARPCSIATPAISSLPPRPLSASIPMWSARRSSEGRCRPARMSTRRRPTTSMRTPQNWVRPTPPRTRLRRPSQVPGRPPVRRPYRRIVQHPCVPLVRQVRFQQTVSATSQKISVFVNNDVYPQQSAVSGRLGKNQADQVQVCGIQTSLQP